MTEGLASTESSAAAPARRPRAIRIAVILYVVAAVVSAPFVIGLFGYGLVHSSGGRLAGMLVALATLFVVMVGLPLFLLRANAGVLKVIGGVVLAIGVVGMAALFHFLVIEPAWMSHRFDEAMRNVQVVSVDEQPVLLEQRVIGVKITREIRLARAMPLDPHGRYALELMQRVFVVAPSTSNTAGSPFSFYFRPGQVSFEGRPVTSDAAATQPLQAGTYRAEHIAYLWGLDGSDGQQPPCRTPTPPQDTAAYALSSGVDLQAVSDTRLSLDYRRGYRNFEAPPVPLKFRYDHAAWMRDLPLLPLETCDTRRARRPTGK